MAEDQVNWVLLPIGVLLAMSLFFQHDRLVTLREQPIPDPKTQPFENMAQGQMPVQRKEPWAIMESPSGKREKRSERKPVAVSSPDLPFLLTGIVIAEGRKTIFLKSRNSNLLKKLREGEELEGWQLEAVTAKDALFSHWGRTQRLVLKKEPVMTRREPSNLRSRLS